MLAYFPHLIQSSSHYSPALSGLQLCQASVQMFLLCGYRVQTLQSGTDFYIFIKVLRLCF